MPDRPDDPNTLWWDFTLDAAEHDLRLTDAGGVPVVNPPGEEGRLGLDYPGYLALDALLSAQTPSSRVPDERIFIVIHQLFELVFKQMTFDLGVVERTFRTLLKMRDHDELYAAAREPLPDERGPSAFWRPAMTAAARLRHSARSVLPAVMQFVGRSANDDVLFSTLEYQRFRDFLVPASGFQSAQLRLIQRALGKNQLLNVRAFPGAAYGDHYQGSPCGHVALGDPLVLREGHSRAFPPAGSPEAAVPMLDAHAHALLGRLSVWADGLPDPPSVRHISADDVDRAAARVRSTLGDAPNAKETTALFREDLAQAVEWENATRATYQDARRGAQALHARHRRSCLAFVLDRIAATDAALHAPDADSFLTVHRQTVRRHVAGDAGTGGGGMPYLVTSQRFLLPLFPALVAYTDLGTAGTDEDSDRW